GDLEELLEVAADRFDVAAAALDDASGAAVVEQGEQEVLEGQVFVTTPLRVFDGLIDGFLEFFTQHSRRPPVPSMPSRGDRSCERVDAPARPWFRRFRGCRPRPRRRRGCARGA